MTARFAALVLVTALLGFLFGARALGSAPAPLSEPAGAAGVREVGDLRGGFWRPAGSDAERPALRLAPVAWTPAAERPAAAPTAVAAVQAALRLASLE